MPGSSGRRKRDNSFQPREVRASMSSFEWNKIIASVLTAMIVAMASGILAGQLVRPKELEKPVFVVAGAEPSASAPRRRGRQPDPSRSGHCSPRPIPREASSSPRSAPPATPSPRADQTRSVRTCGISPRRPWPRCPAISSPPRWKRIKGEKWDPEKFNEWLWKPQALIKGTKMTFAGYPQGRRTVPMSSPISRH